MVEQAVLIIVATSIFVLTAVFARQSATNPKRIRWFRIMWGLILLGFAAYVILSYLTIQVVLLTDPALAQGMGIDKSSGPRGLLAIGLTIVIISYLWLFMISRRVQRLLLWVLPPYHKQPLNYQNAAGEHQARSATQLRPIYLYAAGLAQLFFFQTFIDFIVAGGQAGLAVLEFSQPEIVVSSLFTAGMLLAVAGAGVGLWQDTSAKAVWLRLGLHWPGLTELLAGIGIAVVLLAFQSGAGMVWYRLVPEDVFAQQTQISQAISGSVTSMWAALLVALFSSTGEEIAFRGALQPFMGLWPTTILFALIHIQYQLTPAVLIILVVGLMLGITRKYFGTMVSIATHFFYNFSLLTVAVVANQYPDLLKSLMESGLLLR